MNLKNICHFVQYLKYPLEITLKYRDLSSRFNITVNTTATLCKVTLMF